MSITMTQAAVDYAKDHLQRRGKGVGLRLGVKTTGCSGMAYVVESADNIAADDEVWRLGVVEGLDLRGRPLRVAVGREGGGGLSYAAANHFWRVERRSGGPSAAEPGHDALSADDVAVAPEEGTDAPT